MTGVFSLARVHLVIALVVGLFILAASPVVIHTEVQASTQNAVSTPGLPAQHEFWQDVRKGAAGTVAGGNPAAGQLIQSEGEYWRYLRNGPISKYGAMAILGMFLLLCLFYLLRGRIKIERGWSGWTIERFNNIERFGHWLLAGSFIILGLSGLNMLYGKHVLLPVLGPEAFAMLTQIGKYLHNYLSFAFMLGLVIVFVLWIKDNFPSLADLKWLAVAGGLFTKGSHPPAKRFNAGQKIIFWLVILGGISISLSGLALMFPFQFNLFAKTFGVLNTIGFDFPTQVTPLQELQLSQLWHNIASIFMICVILAHIYIGSVGMEGAFAAMGEGRVDLSWAKEHHSLWVEKLEKEGNLDLREAEEEPEASTQPAE
ncbi:MAG: formate dehydrogenase subunit gamma [Hyphomicrobiales bacterium]